MAGIIQLDVDKSLDRSINEENRSSASNAEWLSRIAVRESEPLQSLGKYIHNQVISEMTLVSGTYSEHAQILNLILFPFKGIRLYIISSSSPLCQGM